MGNQVYANGREISCKAAAGQSIAAFPDVCLSPPPPIAGPIPIPYPNTGMSSDTDSGSKTVQIGGQEVMLKDSSDFKTSTGDEAATQSQGMNVITHKIQGKCFFTAWSMDVKIESENAVRHLDLMTHNHASQVGGTPPWLYADEMAIGEIAACKDDVAEASRACAGQKPSKCSKECKAAQKCILVPKKDDKKRCCSPETTGHHLVEVHCFSRTGARGTTLPGFNKYNDDDAPCVCASQSRAQKSHGILHAVQGQLEAAYNRVSGVLKRFIGAGKLRGDGTRAPAESKWNYGDAKKTGVAAHQVAFPDCDPGCIAKQLDAYHKDKCGLDDDTPLRSDPQAGTRSSAPLNSEQQSVVDRAIKTAERSARRA